MSQTSAPASPRTPTVYFIDDSATMREVVKFAFRRENMNVITCADAASALAEFERHKPDAVISDVIMPDRDGYEVCQFIKKHPQMGSVPVILMSGVVNRNVAEKATAAKADELIRKPFEPQDLVARVKNLLNPKAAKADGEAAAADPAKAFHTVFGLPPLPPPKAARPAAAPAATPPPAAAAKPVTPPPPRSEPPASVEVQRLRAELLRLEHLVKKLQMELEAERQYCSALEAQVKTLQETE